MLKAVSQIASIALSWTFVLFGPLLFVVAWMASIALVALAQFWFVFSLPLLLVASLAGGVFAATTAAKSNQSPALPQKPLGDE
jgi:pilus assembly protein TadC